MARTKEEIFAVLDSHKETIKGFSVKTLSLFGSAVRGEATAGSDLDFVVEFNDLTFDNYMELKFFLEDLFACSVDLVIGEDIKPLLRPIISREMIHVPGL
jgi:predicted nucleotidyltransferase